MRLDPAARSFGGLVVIALAPVAVVAAAGCALASVAGYRLVADGGVSPLQAAALGAAFVALAAAVARGVRSAWLVRRATATLRARLHAEPAAVPARLSVIAGRLGVEVEVVDDGAVYALTYGTRDPRVAVSTGLLAAVDDAELEAVLLHERYHVRHRDPLKSACARVLSAAAFFAPVVGHLQRRYLAARELAADRAAVRACGVRPLAGALYKAGASGPPAEACAAAAMGGGDLLAVRIAQLEDGAPPPFDRLPTAAVTVTAAAVVVLALGLSALVAVVSASLGGAEGAQMSLAGAAACVGGWGAAGGVALRRLVGRSAG